MTNRVSREKRPPHRRYSENSKAVLIAAMITGSCAILAAIIGVLAVETHPNSGSSGSLGRGSRPDAPTSQPTGGRGSTSNSQGSGQNPAPVQQALLQASDLGTGWMPTQLPSGSGPPIRCPTYPQDTADDASVTYSDGNNATVFEEVMKLQDASGAVSTYENTATDCSFTKQGDSGITSTFTYQQDSSAPQLGEQSDVFTVGGTSMQGETPTIDAYSAAIRIGDEVAFIYVAVGLYNEPSESTIIQTILPAAANHLG